MSLLKEAVKHWKTNLTDQTYKYLSNYQASNQQHHSTGASSFLGSKT